MNHTEMQKPSVLIGLCILIATVGSVPLLAELDGDGEVELAAQVTVDEIDLVPTDAAPAAPRVALLFMNTQEGLGSALVTWGRLVRMAANSGAVLIDPFVSAGRVRRCAHLFPSLYFLSPNTSSLQRHSDRQQAPSERRDRGWRETGRNAIVYIL